LEELMMAEFKTLLRLNETDTIIRELTLRGADDSGGMEQLLSQRQHERAALLETLSKPVAQAYERLRARTTDPVVDVVAGCCAGCYRQVPHQIRQRLNGGQGIAQCENCGRFLKRKG
jgi:predicted  nucleic acid-binding Zn-ribbon protein